MMSTIGNITVTANTVGNPTTPAATGTTRGAAADTANERRAETRATAHAVQSVAPQTTSEPPPVAAGKLQLDIDQTTGQVVGRIIDKETGATIKQIPSDEALRLIASHQRMLGAVVDKLL